MSAPIDAWKKGFDEYFLKKRNDLQINDKIVYLNGKIYSQGYLLQEIPLKKHYDKNKTHMKYIKVLYELKK
jgi:hypothetical protein